MGESHRRVPLAACPPVATAELCASSHWGRCACPSHPGVPLADEPPVAPTRQTSFQESLGGLCDLRDESSYHICSRAALGWSAPAIIGRTKTYDASPALVERFPTAGVVGTHPLSVRHTKNLKS